VLDAHETVRWNAIGTVDYETRSVFWFDASSRQGTVAEGLKRA